MQNLLQEKARDLYRCKGVVAFAGTDDKFVFHGVHEQVAFGPDEEGWAPGQKKVLSTPLLPLWRVHDRRRTSRRRVPKQMLQGA